LTIGIKLKLQNSGREGKKERGREEEREGGREGEREGGMIVTIAY
jgi:hypothetical protein